MPGGIWGMRLGLRDHIAIHVGLLANTVASVRARSACKKAARMQLSDNLWMNLPDECASGVRSADEEACELLVQTWP